MTELKYPLFDGERLWDGAAVTIEDGRILSVTACDPAECDKGLLIPGLIDAHTHMGTRAHIEAMLKAGITATCDVSASAELAEHSDKLEIIRSAGMAMGVEMNPKGYVEKAAANGARYIKVLLFNTLSIGKAALKGIVKAAHEKNLKVAVHATELATVRQSVEAGADILLHVPMKEKFPEDLAKTIAEKGIAVAPTLIMMETVIAGHWGEMVPFFLSRLDQALPQSVTKLSRTITETFRQNVYVTPSGIFDYPQLKFCVEVLGADRIIHSVDFPFIGNEGAKPFIENAPISEAEKEMIAHSNAEKLFHL